MLSTKFLFRLSCANKFQNAIRVTSPYCQQCSLHTSPVFLEQSLTDRIYKLSSPKVQPYLDLIRFRGQIGTWLLFIPCTWGTFMNSSGVPFSTQLGIVGLCSVGAFFMRSAGCIINDFWDRDFDKSVERTKVRPLTSGVISTYQAVGVLGLCLTTSLAVLLQFSTKCQLLGVASLAFVVAYPTFKRFTYWPQAFLGCTFNIGIPFCYLAVHDTLSVTQTLPLYVAGICWTLYYDTIYAHQDKKDDALLGLKSTALLFDGDKAKTALGSFATGMTASLAVAGFMNHLSLPFYIGLGVQSYLIRKQLFKLDIGDPKSCGKAFLQQRNIGLFTLLCIISGNML